MPRLLRPALIGLGLLGSALCSAQSFTSGFYGGFELGQARINDNSAVLQQSLVSDLGGSASVNQDTSKLNYRLLAGYKLTENVDLEAGYSQSDAFGIPFSGRSGGNVSYTGSGSVKVHGLDYGVVLRPNVSSGWNPLFLRLGGTHYTAALDVSATAGAQSASLSDSASGSGTLLGVGYDFVNVWPQVDVRASYTQLNKIAGGSSDSKASVYGVSLIKRF